MLHKLEAVLRNHKRNSIWIILKAILQFGLYFTPKVDIVTLGEIYDFDLIITFFQIYVLL